MLVPARRIIQTNAFEKDTLKRVRNTPFNRIYSNKNYQSISGPYA